MTARLELLISDSDPDSSLTKLLAEVGKLHETDPVRLRVTGGVAIWWGTRMLEEAAVAEDWQKRDRVARERRAAARAAKGAPHDVGS